MSKIIAAITLPTGTRGQKQLKKQTQRGVTLIELMVGITIGLLTIAVAMGALMVSRGVSGTVSDASLIQQQASYAMRVIGQQLRQAGSLRLNLDPGTATTESSYLIPAAFEAQIAASGSDPGFNPVTQTIVGKQSPGTDEYTLSVGYRNYTEPVFTSASEISLHRNCLGENGTTALVLSEFVLYTPSSEPNRRELRCKGTSQPQAIINNVANFQVRYLLQDNAVPGTSTIKTVDANGVSNWGQVQAVQVCLVLYGNEPIDIPTGTSYTDCDGSAVIITNLTGTRKNRMHIAFINTFQLRSQGLVGSVLQ